MGVQGWTYLFVGASFGVYLLIAWLTRVRDTHGFYVAGRGVPALANGMATGADWMSAASFLSMAGLIGALGYAGGVYLMGWTGGYVLLALLLAPYLRKFGKFTVPDFLGDRYSNLARLVGVVCAIFVSFVYVAGQMRGVGVVFSRFLEIDIDRGVMIGMAIVFIYAVLGGMKGITWTQVAQYTVLIVAFLLPAFAISYKLTGMALPQVGMGSRLMESTDGSIGPYLLDTLDKINRDLGFASYTEPFAAADWNRLNVLCVVVALMVGTAGLPHIIVRFYTTRTVSAARWSAFWALFFIALLYLTAPATGAFSRYFLINSIQGKTEAQLPAWFQTWQKTGLIYWMDDGDGVVRYSNRDDNEIFRVDKVERQRLAEIRAQHQAFIDSRGASGADGRAELRRLKLSGPDMDIMVLATPEMAGLAAWIVALVAAGGLAAALSTASGLLLVISSAVAHDVYARVIAPQSSEAQRLLVGRVTIGLAVIVAGLFGIYPPGFVSQVVAFAFGLAASSFFPAIVLGIFSKRVGTVPAVAGMLVGIGFTSVYIIQTVFLGYPKWCLGIRPEGIGAVGMLLNFATTLLLTPLFASPGAAVSEMIDRIREPEGVGPAVAIETTPEN